MPRNEKRRSSSPAEPPEDWLDALLGLPKGGSPAEPPEALLSDDQREVVRDLAVEAARLSRAEDEAATVRTLERHPTLANDLFRGMKVPEDARRGGDARARLYDQRNEAILAANDKMEGAHPRLSRRDRAGRVFRDQSLAREATRQGWHWTREAVLKVLRRNGR